jgi:GT2 family glycosyltransferase
MCKKEIYLGINGMDEEHFPVSLNDIDLCLRHRERGFFNVMTPYCEAYHAEAVSRGLDETVGKVLRFYREAAYFKRRHAWILRNGDPYYNKNLPLFQNGLY